jgi:LEA14-like dessication related protein
MRKLLVIASLLLLVSCGKIVEPEFRRIDGFGLKKFGFKESVIGFNVVYHNPNNFSLQVKETVLDVYLDSVLLGQFTQVNQVEVKENQEFSIPLQGSVSMEKAIDMNLQDLVNKEVLVRAKGVTRVGKGGVFIKKDIDYSGSHKIDASLLKNPAGAGSN